MNKISIVLSFALTILTGQVMADANKPLALRKIMQELEINMKSITDGISTQNWDVVKDSAEKIAQHPTPPFFEKLKILSYVGSNIGQYKKFNGNTSDAAELLNKAAEKKDNQAVSQAYLQLKNSCVECHDRFLKPFVKHFYDE